MRWIITKDLIADTDNGEKPVVGYGDFPQKMLSLILAAPKEAMEPCVLGFFGDKAVKFRLYDDDGELYYEGVCEDLLNADQDHAFAPLDWAEAFAGCTRMDYFADGCTWETL